MGNKENTIQESEKKMRKNQGILFIIFAAFFFALMNLFVKLAGDLPTYEKAFFRNIVAIFVSLSLLLKDRKDLKVRKEHIGPLLIRASAGTIGILCNFYAVSELNIADASMLNKLSPFFAVIFSIFILKEKTTLQEIGTVVIAFIGALFVIKPSMHMEAFPAWIGVLGGLGAGLAYTYVRKLGKMGLKSSFIVFFFSAFSCVVMIPMLIYHFVPMQLIQFVMLILAGCAATGGQFAITLAYTKAPAKEISVFDYSQIIFAALLSFIVLNQVPDHLSIIGYVIIIGVAILKWYYQNRNDHVSTGR